MESDTVALVDATEAQLQILLEAMKIKKEYRDLFHSNSVNGAILNKCNNALDIANVSNVPIKAANVLLPFVLEWKKHGVPRDFNRNIPSIKLAKPTPRENPLTKPSERKQRENLQLQQDEQSDLENPNPINSKIPLVNISCPMLQCLLESSNLAICKENVRDNLITGTILQYCDSAEDIKEVVGVSLPIAKALFLLVELWKKEGVPQSSTVFKENYLPQSKTRTSLSIQLKTGKGAAEEKEIGGKGFFQTAYRWFVMSRKVYEKYKDEPTVVLATAAYSIIMCSLSISSFATFYTYWLHSPGCCGQRSSSDLGFVKNVLICGTLFTVCVLILGFIKAYIEHFKVKLSSNMNWALIAVNLGLRLGLHVIQIITVSTEGMITQTKSESGMLQALFSVLFFSAKDIAWKAYTSSSEVMEVRFFYFYFLNFIACLAVAIIVIVALAKPSLKFDGLCWGGIADDCNNCYGGTANGYVACPGNWCLNEYNEAPTNTYTNSYGTVSEYCSFDCCYWKLQ